MDAVSYTQFLSLIEKLLNGNLAADQFCTQFTRLWMKERDAVYARKATWPEPYDELLIAAFQRGEMTGSQFRSEHAKLWGYDENDAFQEMINEIHSTCSVFSPTPELEGEIDEQQLKYDVKKSLDSYQETNKPFAQAI